MILPPDIRFDKACARNPNITQNFLRIQYCSAILILPIGGIALLCIVKASPWEMKAFKPILLTYQISLIFSDLILTLFVIPDFLFPILGGYPLGILSLLGTPSLPQLIIACSTFLVMFASIAHIFFHRHQTVIPSSYHRHLSKVPRIISISSLYLFPQSCLIFSYNLVPNDLTEVKIEVARENSCYPVELFNEQTIVVNRSTSILLAKLIIFMLVGSVLLIGLLVVDTFYCLKQSCSHLSERSRQLIKNSLNILIVQGTIPQIFAFIPISIFMVIVITEIQSQEPTASQLTPCLVNLPNQIFLQILSYLSPKEYINIRRTCKKVNTVMTEGWRYLNKYDNIAELDIEVQENEAGTSKFTISAATNDLTLSISPEKLTIETSESLQFHLNSPRALKNPHIKKRLEQCRGFRSYVERELEADQMDGSFPVDSLEVGFKSALEIFLKKCNCSALRLHSPVRMWTEQELSWVLHVIKNCKTKVGGLFIQTDKLTDQYMELIQKTSCQRLSLGMLYSGSGEEPVLDHGELSVDRRIKEVFLPCLTFYADDLVSVGSIISILNEWRYCSRPLEEIIYHHTSHETNWFCLLEDFPIVTAPYAHIWTMNATIHVTSFVLGREMDDQQIEINYYTYYGSSYLKVSRIRRVEERMALARDFSKMSIKEEGDENEDYEMFGLFD